MRTDIDARVERQLEALHVAGRVGRAVQAGPSRRPRRGREDRQRLALLLDEEVVVFEGDDVVRRRRVDLLTDDLVEGDERAIFTIDIVNDQLPSVVIDIRNIVVQLLRSTARVIAYWVPLRVS